MSSVPYVATLPTDFNGFPTQVMQFGIDNYNMAHLTVPNGVWWRIIYVNVGYTASSTVDSRSLYLQVYDGTGAIVVRASTPLTVPASSTGVFLFAPNAAGFSVPATYGSAPIPDLIWPTGTEIQVATGNYHAGDNWAVLTVAGIEIFTENTSNGVTTLVPAPITL
jgi:hypothetical protein